MNELILTEINIYPVKSLGGISLNSALAEERGLQFDRRWMLVDEQGVFISQRECAEMVFIGVRICDIGFELFYKPEPEISITIPFHANKGEVLKVRIWEDICESIHYSALVDQWLINLLKIKCRLVYMPDSSRRIVDLKYTTGKEIVSFADGYPFLIIGEATLLDLNNKLEKTVLMNRFRPNFVFSGDAPYAEDTWKKFSIGEVKFKGVKPCGRCVITTIDQKDASKSAEPLKTLSTYRKSNNNVLLGQNLVLQQGGVVKLGDSLMVEEFVY
jgi:uncharacterized protein